MMGLAGIGSLSEKFITEAEEVTETEELQEQMPGEEEEEMVDEPLEDPEGDLGEPMPEEPALGDEEMDMEGGDLEGEMPAEEPAAGGQVSVDAILAAFEQALESVLGGEEDVEVARAEEEPVEDDLAMAEGDYADDVMEDLDAAGVELEEDSNLEEDIVNEITRRVARRLLRESAKTKK
tara:strand:+ start:727 stop:1263 length:537 start_codon:yes stop_codon:yes gene_type:complete